MDEPTSYDDHVVAWSEQQVAALRILAARPDLSNAVDWPNLIEEVACLGRSEWTGVESPAASPFTLDQMLAPSFGYEEALSRFDGLDADRTGLARPPLSRAYTPNQTGVVP
jgi:hypothetical protein